jgi:hypothetical protein
MPPPPASPIYLPPRERLASVAFDRKASAMRPAPSSPILLLPRVRVTSVAFDRKELGLILAAYGATGFHVSAEGAISAVVGNQFFPITGGQRLSLNESDEEIAAIALANAAKKD